MGGGAARGTDLFATYTTYGDPDGETWHPRFHYLGMQWVQVTGLPPGCTRTEDTLTGLQLHADVPVAGDVRTSDDRINRINRIHRMARYSIMSNTMSTFTDCPGREKPAYPADYLQPFASLHRTFGYDAYLRTMQRHLAEGQSRSGDDIGNVALKAPCTRTRKAGTGANAYIVDAALADWIAAENTSCRILAGASRNSAAICVQVASYRARTAS